MALRFSSRDRTNEFQSLILGLRSKPEAIKQSPANEEAAKSVPKADLEKRKRFILAARKIGQRLTTTCIKLEELAQLAKKRSLFDDKTKEIAILTYDIKREINDTNANILQLQDFVQSNKKYESRNIQKHSSTVVYTLQSKLANVSKDFKNVLEVRNENMKHQDKRSEHFFSKSMLNPPEPMLSTPPRLPGDKMGKSVLYEEPTSTDTVLNMDSLQKQQLHKQRVVDETSLFLQDRANALQEIEKTIVEVGSMFSQVAQLVKDQEELIQRIDVEVEKTGINVELGNDELAKHFKSISSNKWLIIKVFFVIILFMVFFLIVLA